MIDILGIHIKHPSLSVFVLYRQPGSVNSQYQSKSSDFVSAIREIQQTINRLGTPSPDIILCGDFNLPHVHWPAGIVSSGASLDERLMVEELKDITDEIFLQQIVHSSTHRAGNMLNLIFTNNDTLIHNCTITPTELSDHFIIECASLLWCDFTEENGGAKTDPQNLSSLNFRDDSIDWNKIKSELYSVDWTKEFDTLNINETMTKFLDISYQITKHYVPLKS